jgi:hypothetical protein
MSTIQNTEEGRHNIPQNCSESLKCTVSNNMNILQTSQKCVASRKKLKEHNMDILFHDDIRQRTYSMPTRGTIKKPDKRQLQRVHFRLSHAVDNKTYSIRSFEVNSKGVITKRPDSLRLKGTNSIYSSEGDFCINLRQQITSSSESKESLHESNKTVDRQEIVPSHVMVLGGPGVGKTGLAQQFMTLEYLGGFNTSVGKQRNTCFECCFGF